MHSATRRKRNFLTDFFGTSPHAQKTTVGIDVSDDAVRFLSFPHGTSVRVGQSGLYSVPRALSSEGVISNEAGLIAALSAIKAKTGASSVVTTVPDQNVSLFRAKVKMGSSKDAPAAIAPLIPKHTPLSLGDVVWNYAYVEDYNVRSNPRSFGMREVVVSVFPKNGMASFRKIFQEVGLTPSFLLRSQAIAHAVIRKGDTYAHLLVHIEDRYTTLSIISGGIVQSVSTTPVRAGSLEEKKTFSLLKDEIDNRYIASHTRDSKKESMFRIREVILVGALSNPEELKEKLALALRLPVELGNVWTNAFSLDHHIPSITFTESLPYAAAVGCALGARL